MADTDTDTPIQDVADTAFWIAHYRAEETARPDALFKDPLASVLAGERGRRIAREMPMAHMTRWQAVVRTCIIDAYVRAAVAGGVDTVLNLGAGLDTRPYRMDLPATLRWIEVDQANVIAFKTERLASYTPRCTIERHAVDLADGAARRALLERVSASARRILVLTEGVVPYLSIAEAGALADDLRQQANIVGWIVDYHSRRVMKYRALKMSRKIRNAPFRFTPDDWHGFYASHGWRTKEARYLPEEGQRLGRPFPAPLWMRLLMGVGRRLAPPSRRDELSKGAGYVLLEPAPRG
jgi:methyltransferase (TIGR00027 family)